MILNMHLQLHAFLILLLFMTSSGSYTYEHSELTEDLIPHENFNKPETTFIHKLFRKYGSNHSIAFQELDALLGNLGINRKEPLITKTNKKSNKKLNKRSRRQLKILNEEEKCYSAQDFFKIYEVEPSQPMNTNTFLSFCPALIEQLDSKVCQQQLRNSYMKKYPNGHSKSETLHNKVVSIETEAGSGSASKACNGTETGAAYSKPRVWLFSFICITVISLVGLAGVAVVPLVQATFYNHFIQYLVALAVGTLTGDAFLHLLPHAIVKSAMEDAHAEAQHKESETVYKGLVALGGVYFFFIAEKIVALVSDYRTEKAQLEAEEKKDAEEGMPMISTLERQKRRVSKLYGQKSCEDIMTTGLSSKALRSIDNFIHSEHSDNEHEDDHDHCVHNQLSKQTCNEEHNSPSKTLGVPQNAYTNNENNDKETTNDELDNVKVLVPEQKSHAKKEHGHGHGHGHDMPESMVSVAWMVIFGDGLHNFTDGMAIGAAFAVSITGGISTSVAVFCHELPHELGDFAVLLKTGMRVRQALFYNVLSSILAAVGMVIGIFLGGSTTASYWIFAITAGIFIYISLVNMLPELNLVNVKPGESRIAHFLIQNAGIMTGVGIMFLIAMFEEDIKNIFDNPNASSNSTILC